MDGCVLLAAHVLTEGPCSVVTWKQRGHEDQVLLDPRNIVQGVPQILTGVEDDRLLCLFSCTVALLRNLMLPCCLLGDTQTPWEPSVHNGSFLWIFLDKRIPTYQSVPPPPSPLCFDGPRPSRGLHYCLISCQQVPPLSEEALQALVQAGENNLLHPDSLALHRTGWDSFSNFLWFRPCVCHFHTFRT